MTAPVDGAGGRAEAALKRRRILRRRGYQAVGRILPDSRALRCCCFTPIRLLNPKKPSAAVFPAANPAFGENRRRRLFQSPLAKAIAVGLTALVLKRRYMGAPHGDFRFSNAGKAGFPLSESYEEETTVSETAALEPPVNLIE